MSSTVLKAAPESTTLISYKSAGAGLSDTLPGNAAVALAALMVAIPLVIVAKLFTNAF